MNSLQMTMKPELIWSSDLLALLVMNFLEVFLALKEQSSSSHQILSEDFINAPKPKIIYASRTHSQLSQTIQELKNTVFKFASFSFHVIHLI